MSIWLDPASDAGAGLPGVLRAASDTVADSLRVRAGVLPGE